MAEFRLRSEAATPAEPLAGGCASQWIAVHLPELPLQAWAATLAPAQRQEPLALLQGPGVVAVNALALALGITPGCKRATAFALAPNLCCGQASAAREQQALQAVAHAALAFAPNVVLDAECGYSVLLEVRATLRYFGGLAALLKRLHTAIEPLGFGVRVATAPTAEGAALLARWRAGPVLGLHSRHLAVLHTVLDGLPVALLAQGSDQTLRLQAMGLHTLGQLRAQPRDGLARRFGTQLLAQIDRARGEQPELRPPFVPARTFDSRLELYERADNTEQVLHGAHVLVLRLVAWARAQQARVGCFELKLRHEQRHRQHDDVPAFTGLTIQLAQPSDDPAHLQVLLRERLQPMPLPAPTLELQLCCDALSHTPNPSGDLFPTRASQREGMTRLLERLQARLGVAQVQQLVLVEDHRPECASLMQPVQPGVVPASAPMLVAEGKPLLPISRPVWLLQPAQPLQANRAGPVLQGRALALRSGPERIETGWWDGALALRDYYVAQAHDGALVWVYQDRQPSAGKPQWYLHGRFG